MNRKEYKSILSQEMEQLEKCRKTGAMKWKDAAIDAAMRRSDTSLYLMISRERQAAELELERHEVESAKIELGLSL